MINQEQIIELYKEGKSAYEILPLTPYAQVRSIYNLLKKHGVPIRSRAGNKNPNLVSNYFSVVDSEAKAYFLGLLYADGSIEVRKNSQTKIQLELNKNDGYIIELFKKELQSDNVISTTRHDCLRFSVHSNKIAEDLSHYMIFPNKSHRHDELRILDEPYMSHFIRGVFDGDGWVYERKYGLTFGICGTKEATESLERYLRLTLNIPKVKVASYENKVPFFTHSSKESVKKIYDYLYSNATIYLKRKKEVFDKAYANPEVTD